MMKAAKIMIPLFVALLMISFVPSPASAQVCGDADESNDVDLGDLVAVIEYLLNPGWADFINHENADCDHRIGVTAGDVNELIYYFFIELGDLTCSPTLTYTYPAAPNDTIWFPRWESIPEEVDEVVMPIKTNFTTDARTIYFSLIGEGVVGDDTFVLDSMYAAGQHVFGSSNVLYRPDTVFACFSQPYGSGFIGEGEHLFIVAQRQSPGPGSFIPEVIDRSPELRTCIASRNDLLIPVIQYYDYTPEPSTLVVDPIAVELTATTDEPVSETVPIDFTADGQFEIDYTLSWSADWLTVSGYTDPMTTPSGIEVTADGTGLIPGEYADVIEIELVQPGSAITPVTQIPVTFTLGEKPPYPIGDLDCSGEVSLGDLTIMIYYLFIKPGPIPPCE